MRTAASACAHSELLSETSEKPAPPARKTYPRPSAPCLSCTRPIRPGGLREASWAGGDCGFRVPDRCRFVRRGGADFAQAEQAGLRPRRASKRSSPPDTRARSRAARGRRCSTSSTSQRHRHAAVDCERRKAPRIPRMLQPETPQAKPGRGFRRASCRVKNHRAGHTATTPIRSSVVRRALASALPRAAGEPYGKQNGLRALSDRPRPSCRARSSTRTKPSAPPSASSCRPLSRP